jgi:4-aminobutyrate aminotransferase-like enzyme
LFIGIEFIDENLNPDTKLASHVKNFLKDNFILTGTDGPFDNVLKIKPPMCFNKSNVDVFIAKLRLSLD